MPKLKVNDVNIFCFPKHLNFDISKPFVGVYMWFQTLANFGFTSGGRG